MENDVNDTALIDAQNYALAGTWADGLALEFSGVDLADAMKYNLESVLGRIWKAALIAPPIVTEGASVDTAN